MKSSQLNESMKRIKKERSERRDSSVHAEERKKWIMLHTEMVYYSLAVTKARNLQLLLFSYVRNLELDI